MSAHDLDRGGSPGLALAVERRAGAVVVAVAGEMDMAGGDRLRAFLAGVLAGRPSAVTVDLAEVTFADSVGIRELVRAYEVAAAQGTSFTVANCQPTVRRVLEITNLYSLLTGEGPARA